MDDSLTASVEQRLAAVQAVMQGRGMEPLAAIEKGYQQAEEDWVPRNGARMVARAWTDPGYRARLFADGKAAAEELGFAMPPHHRYLVALENTADLHNVIVCTLCSCTAFTIIGLPPDWYKSIAYRSRAVREPRGVLEEFGVHLAVGRTVRVHDSTADMRYVVIPMRPVGTEGFSEEQLQPLVTRDSMIGVEEL